MSKYIDKEVLLERMNRTRPYEGADGSFERHRRLQWLADMEQVNMCPAADVQEVVKEWCYERNCVIVAREDFPRLEVRHGRWLHLHLDPDNITGHTKGECSICGKLRIVDNYCPNCGAKMDETEETFNATQHTDCVENALDALDEVSE